MSPRPPAAFWGGDILSHFGKTFVFGGKFLRLEKKFAVREKYLRLEQTLFEFEGIFLRLKKVTRICLVALRTAT